MAYKRQSAQPVIEGGTGAITLTDHGVLLGSGTGAVTAAAVGTNGQVLVGSTGADPAFATLTSSGSTISYTPGAGSLNVDLVVPVVVASGGTGATSMTAYAVVCGGTTSTNPLQSVASVGTSGQVLTSNGAGALPTFQPASGGGLTWAVTTVDASLVASNGYIANKAGLLTMTLPATSAVGDVIRITGINTAVGWRIAQNATQQIFFGTSSTTVGVGGYLEATAIRDSVEMVCVVAGTASVFNVLSSVGNITIV